MHQFLVMLLIVMNLSPFLSECGHITNHDLIGQMVDEGITATGGGNEDANVNTATLRLDGRSYEIKLEDNPTAREIFEMLPLTLTLTPYSNLEYSARLPETPVYDGSPVTEDARLGTINYCKEYNSFVVICQDHHDPFQEVKIAEIQGDISWMVTAGDSIEAEITKNGKAGE